MKNCVFRGFHDFLRGLHAELLSAREYFVKNCLFHRTHEELYSSWIPWRIALLMGFVTNCSAFGLRRELLSSQIWWTISFFEDSMKSCILRASQAEPYIFHSLHKLRLGFAIEPWRAVFFMDFMKNCILPGFLQKCFMKEKLHGKHYSSWISWKIAVSHNLRQNFTLRCFHEKSLSGKISWRNAFFMDFMKNCVL